MTAKDVLQYFTPIVMMLGSVCIPAWVRVVIRNELKTPLDKLDDHGTRLEAMEQWRLLVGADVKSIPATNAMLERLETTMNRTDNTLDRLNSTCERMIERVARLEGQGRRSTDA
jgi:hypothetical protein